MMECELRKTERIAILRPAPRAPMSADDFKRAASTIDPFIAATGPLNGVMLDARVFPGWRDGRALLAHANFIRRHQGRVKRVALVTDSGFLGFLWRVARRVVRPEVGLFPYKERERAFAWLGGQVH